jgi:uncharacterized membrane protein YhaH (DUF805 family)
MGLLTGAGRIGRLQYFAIQLTAGIVTVFVGMTTTTVDEVTGEPQISPLYLLVAALAAWVNVTSGIRRLHDTGYSGWVLLLSLVPFVNLGLAFYLLFKGGEPGANRFGPPPGLEAVRLGPEASRDRAEQIKAAAAEAYAERSGVPVQAGAGAPPLSAPPPPGPTGDSVSW